MRSAANRIRLLLMISDLGGGGAERELSVLLRHLSRDRFEPHIGLWRPVFRYDPPADVPVHLVRKTKPWHLPQAIRGTQRLVRELAPDLIYSHLHYVSMVTGTALSLSRRRPRWIARQYSDPRREMQGPFAAWARWALSRVDRVAASSRGVSRATVEHLHIPPSRVVTIDNPVDVAEVERLAQAPLPIAKTPETFTVVHAGRFHPQKNQPLLLEAFAQLRGRRAELWMLGEGEEGARLKELARSLGIAEQVRWLGFQENPFPFFRAADCLALSSDYEGLPNVIIEAMLCGTAVVSTRCPFGPDELIEDGVGGLLVPVRDAQALGGAFLRLAGENGLVERMGTAARASARARFDTVRGCAAFEKLFERVVHDGTPSRS